MIKMTDLLPGKSATERDIARWFNRWYSRKKLNSMRKSSAYPVYLEYLRAQAGKQLLDVGCGPGWLLKASSERGLKSLGFDISHEAARLARFTAPQAMATVSRVTDIPAPDASFDYITCIGVLEHFTDMDRSISEMKRVAKSDAIFCIMVPNSSTIYWKLAEKFSSNHWESNENALSLSQWKEFFRSRGFLISDIRRDEWITRKILSWLGLAFSPWLLKKIQHLIWSIVPLKYSHQFVFLLKQEM